TSSSTSTTINGATATQQVAAAAASAPQVTRGDPISGFNLKPTWGMFSVPTSPVPSLPNVSVVVLEFTWSSAEPQQGVYNESYFSNLRNIIAAWQAAGIRQFVLNFGMHNAPSWLLNMPNGRLVDQHGVAWTGDNTPNLFFNATLRSYAADYTNKVFSELGTNWYAIRVGGGPLGELDYPTLRNDSNNSIDPCPSQRAGFVCPYYWAFDGAAQASDPVRGWLPGQSSPNGQASTFLNWYLDSLKNFQNWQVSTVRAACPSCPVAVLYPSWGMRSGDFQAAVNDNLAGASSPELNGEVQGGRDHQRQITGLTDANTIVWGTWCDNSGTVSWLAGLALQQHLPMMGENGGPGATSKATALISNALTYGMRAAFWIRYADPGTDTFLAGI
ncbi:MAG: beta-galactosidase, partial [Candidatus Dormibacteria bacterium]